jgi:glycosyltransferase involved in cell wall biosynthesis
VVTVHDLNWLINPRYNYHHPLRAWAYALFYRPNLIAALREADRILSVSRSTRRAIIEYAPWYAHKICVTYNGFDPTRLRPLARDEAYARLAPYLEPERPFILTVGQGAPYKNHLNAVRGFMAAFGGRSDYRMILVQRTASRDSALQAMLRHPQVQAQVQVLPYATPEMLNALLSVARVLLHPSYYEGFGLPLVEAMAMGTPIVTSKVSAMPEVVGPAAMLVDPADPHAIASALVTLDRDEALRKRLIAAGLKRVRRFHWRLCAAQTLQVYRELAQREGPLYSPRGLRNRCKPPECSPIYFC